jgi:glutamyl-tRNA reductase
MTGLGYISVSGCRPSLSLLESLTYSRDELREHLPVLQRLCGASALMVLSTCQRVELYATWDGPADPAALLRALSADRGVSSDEITAVATSGTQESATRHLLRVVTGLESFVLGESEIAGQVRAAAEASRSAGSAGLVLDRLMATAVNTSRRAHRQGSMGASVRSVAGAGVAAAVELTGGALTGRRVLVVGAGEVAATVVERASALGASVTVCNRTRRHADQFTAAGAAVVYLVELGSCLATADVAVLATAAPHWLVDGAALGSREETARPIVLVDLAMPRNVDPAVRTLEGVRLVDLADLRATGSQDARLLVEDVARVERVVQEELLRFGRWLARRSASNAVRRLRRDVMAIADRELARTTAGLPADVRALVEQAVGRVVGQLAHGPTRELLAAAEAGDVVTTKLLAGLFDTGRAAAPGQDRSSGQVREDDARAATWSRRSGLDHEVRQVGALDQAFDQGSVQTTHQLATGIGEIGEDAVAQ